MSSDAIGSLRGDLEWDVTTPLILSISDNRVLGARIAARIERVDVAF